MTEYYELYRCAREDMLLYKAALEEIVRREARSEYSSIYAAPGEFAAVAREALTFHTSDETQSRTRDSAPPTPRTGRRTPEEPPQ